MSQPPETPPSDTSSKPSTLPSQIQQPNPNPTSVSTIPSSPTTPQSPSLNPNPNPPQYTRPPVTSPATSQQQHHPIGRPPPPAYSRPWQQPQQQHSYTHFSSASSPLISSSSAPASSSSTPTSSSGQQRGSNVAIGVPASPVPGTSPAQPSPSPSSAFPGSFGQQQYGGLGRGTVAMSEATSVPQVRMMQGTQGIGMMGTLGSGSQMRPSGMPQHQQRPVQSSLRPASTPTSQAPVVQNFQGHSHIRPTPMGSPGVHSTSAAQQSMQAINQPWLSSSAQGKPPLPPPSYRPQVNTPAMQQRPHPSQQHLSTSAATSQPQQQQQSQHQHQPQEQLQQLRSPQQPLQSQHPHQQARVQGMVNQKGTSMVMPPQPPMPQPGTQAKTVSTENEVSDGRVLGKRSIHELLQQIDPSEKLDPEVEDVLADIAEDFVESITTFGCTLAKHRKSDTLEAKDILLHVERNWNIRPPGFSGDEIKTYRKPHTTDIHKERLAVVKKSLTATEAANARNPFGHGTANARGGQAKTAANPMASTTFNH